MSEKKLQSTQAVEIAVIVGAYHFDRLNKFFSETKSMQLAALIAITIDKEVDLAEETFNNFWENVWENEPRMEYALNKKVTVSNFDFSYRNKCTDYEDFIIKRSEDYVLMITASLSSADRTMNEDEIMKMAIKENVCVFSYCLTNQIIGKVDYDSIQYISDPA